MVVIQITRGIRICINSFWILHTTAGPLPDPFPFPGSSPSDPWQWPLGRLQSVRFPPPPPT